MRPFLQLSLMIFTVIGFEITVFAQSTTNPDISFIGDFQSSIHTQQDSIDKGKPVVEFKGLEIFGSGPLNPYARADVTLSVSKEEVDIEEAYITMLRGIPLNLQFKAGKYLVDVGKLNTQHPHQWTWINRPLMYQELFGEEGLNDIGINLNMLQPFGDGSLGISANWLKTGGLFPDTDLALPYAPSRIEMAGATRLSLFYPTSEYSNLDYGVSFLRGQFHPVRLSYKPLSTPSTPSDQPLSEFSPQHRYATVGVVDLKWKYKPDNYNGFQVVAEYMTQSRTFQNVAVSIHSLGDTTFVASDHSVTSKGLFTVTELRWDRRYNAGILYDYTQGISDKNTYRSAYGVYAGFSVAEETTRFGLVYRRNQSNGMNPYHVVTLQILWLLGPHKPHLF